LLAKLGMPGMLETIKARIGTRPPGRPDFAKEIIARGAARNDEDAFRKYLGQGKTAYVKIAWPELVEAIAWIRQAGGVAVLAHPGRYKLTRTKLSALIAEFHRQGGQAIEVVTPGQDPGKTEQLANFAERWGLMASLGSDFHGSRMPWSQLGRYPALPTRCRPVWMMWEDGFSIQGS
jgi:predicted metal-dependent phosphoesterase TrpH